ncbi:hypothetical protein ABT294_15320 [Nonomuraea sp. NPDC000554]
MGRHAFRRREEVMIVAKLVKRVLGLHRGQMKGRYPIYRLR